MPTALGCCVARHVPSRPLLTCVPCLFRPAQPLFTIIFGALMDVLTDPPKLQTQLTKFAFYFLYLGAGSFVAFYGKAAAGVSVIILKVRCLCFLPPPFPHSPIRALHHHQRASDLSHPQGVHVLPPPPGHEVVRHQQNRGDHLAPGRVRGQAGGSAGLLQVS